MVQLSSTTLLLLCLACTHAESVTVTPTQSEILCKNSTCPVDPTPNYHDYLPYIYVVFGFDGRPHVRAIIEPTDECPTPLDDHDGKENEQLKLLDPNVNMANADLSKLPYYFPVKLCNLIVGEGSEWFDDIQKGDMKLVFSNNAIYNVPAVKRNPRKFALLGDTGLRIKPSNLGYGKLGADSASTGGYDCKNAGEFYGINQCFANITEADINSKEASGSFQSIDEWPFKMIADSVANEEADVIVYVGDYLYRQGPCPHDAKDTQTGQIKNCSAVNAPSQIASVQDNTVMNFYREYDIVSA